MKAAARKPSRSVDARDLIDGAIKKANLSLTAVEFNKLVKMRRATERLCHVRGFYLSIELGALSSHVNISILGHMSPSQIGSEIAYSWPM
jgi:hypothetical protein